MLGTQEIIIIALVILLLFGGKKIPELMKGLGKGVKSFKEGVNGIDTDNAPEAQTKAEAQSANAGSQSANAGSQPAKTENPSANAETKAAGSGEAQ